WVLRRVGVREVPADRRLMTDADGRDARERLGERRMVGPHRFRPLDLPMCGERPAPESVALEPDPAQLLATPKADDMAGADEPLPVEDRERGAARERDG